MEINLRDDLRLVQNVRRHAYIKSDAYTVGAVIKTKSGRKYTGCNIEIEDSEIIWAEKTALLKAISEGEKEFDYMVVMAGKKNEEPEKYLPCKACKEFINHFVDSDFKIYCIYENKIEQYVFSQIFSNN